MIQKASGETEAFSEQKLRRSLEKSGADPMVVDTVAAFIAEQVRNGATKNTKEIYARAFAMLKGQQRSTAARYSLKRALFALGPSGFPFEQYVARLFGSMGYAARVGVILEGKCIKHEVDIVLTKGETRGFAECKFHNMPGMKCDVKTPMYVLSRFEDICERDGAPFKHGTGREGWLVTNTRFSEDALAFAKCAGIRLMGWDVGALGESIERLIDKRGLHPVTCLTTLSMKEKSALLAKTIVLCEDLFDGTVLTDVLRVPPEKQQRIIREAKELCRHMANH